MVQVCKTETKFAGEIPENLGGGGMSVDVSIPSRWTPELPHLASGMALTSPIFLIPVQPHVCCLVSSYRTKVRKYDGVSSINTFAQVKWRNEESRPCHVLHQADATGSAGALGFWSSTWPWAIRTVKPHGQLRLSAQWEKSGLVSKSPNFIFPIWGDLRSIWVILWLLP